jgi:hypothetical protein
MIKQWNIIFEQDSKNPKELNFKSNLTEFSNDEKIELLMCVIRSIDISKNFKLVSELNCSNCKNQGAKNICNCTNGNNFNPIF